MQGLVAMLHAYHDGLDAAPQPRKSLTQREAYAALSAAGLNGAHLLPRLPFAPSWEDGLLRHVGSFLCLPTAERFLGAWHALDGSPAGALAEALRAVSRMDSPWDSGLADALLLNLNMVLASMHWPPGAARLMPPGSLAEAAPEFTEAWLQLVADAAAAVRRLARPLAPVPHLSEWRGGVMAQLQAQLARCAFFTASAAAGGPAVVTFGDALNSSIKALGAAKRRALGLLGGNPFEALDFSRASFSVDHIPCVMGLLTSPSDALNSQVAVTAREADAAMGYLAADPARLACAASLAEHGWYVSAAADELRGIWQEEHSFDEQQGAVRDALHSALTRQGKPRQLKSCDE